MDREELSPPGGVKSDPDLVVVVEPEGGSALHEARRRRRDLRDAIVEVEDAISAPGPGRLPRWTERVRASLERLREAFSEHMRATEAVGGLYDDIHFRAPHLSGKVDRLRRDHPIVSAAIEERMAEVAAPCTKSECDAVRDDIQRLLGKIVRHRQHGSDLVWEAYNLDIGGEG